MKEILIHLTTCAVQTSDLNWHDLTFDRSEIREGLSAIRIENETELKEAMSLYYHHALRTTHPTVQKLGKRIIALKSAVVLIDPKTEVLEDRPVDGSYHVFLKKAPADKILSIVELIPEWKRQDARDFSSLARPIDFKRLWTEQLVKILNRQEIEI